MQDARYVCSRCGKPGIPDEKTMLDARYTTGKCSGDHVERQVLILSGFNPTDHRKKKRPTTQVPDG